MYVDVETGALTLPSEFYQKGSLKLFLIKMAERLLVF